MNQRQRNLIREALELKALQDDEDTAECLELLEQVDSFQVSPVGQQVCHKAAEDLSRACPECFSELELRIFHTGPGSSPTRWPYCIPCGKRRHRALSVSDAMKFQRGELKL